MPPGAEPNVWRALSMGWLGSSPQWRKDRGARTLADRSPKTTAYFLIESWADLPAGERLHRDHIRNAAVMGGIGAVVIPYVFQRRWPQRTRGSTYKHQCDIKPVARTLPPAKLGTGFRCHKTVFVRAATHKYSGPPCQNQSLPKDRSRCG